MSEMNQELETSDSGADNGQEGPPKTILVAQRVKVELEFLGAFLHRVGNFQVLSAASARELIEKVQWGPDLILVDPEIDGNVVRAVEIMRRMPGLNHVGIAVMTGDLRQLQRCHNKGFNAFIPKPFAPATLLAKIWKILESTPPIPGDGEPARLEVDVGAIEDLPTLPTVYARVEQLCEKPDTDADELGKVIETDPSITVKLLKLSNSPFFGFNREIKTVKDAVSLLGNQTVKNAVLSISVFEATKGMDESAGLDKTEFWKHSAACGSIARFISKKMRIDREDSFAAGVLHDIGKVILDGMYSEFYGKAIEAVASRGMSLLEAEEAELGLNHARLGAELATNWGIPRALVEALAFHHRPHKANQDPELASLVQIGDAVSRNLGVGSGGDSYVPAIHPSALSQLAIGAEELSGWEAEMSQQIDKDMAFLSAIV